MDRTQQDFAEQAYAPRAADYVSSAVHASGPDLEQIAAALQGHADAEVLDLGCGGGHVAYTAAPHVRAVTACDVTQAMLDAVAETAAARGLTNISTRRAAAEHLPFAGAAFDVVLSRFTAHHWQDFAAGLREARRVLKPGGFAIFIDSVAPEAALLDTHLQAIELLRDASHVRNFTPSQWVAALGAAGFAVASLTPRTLRMEFPVWVARTRTPDVQVAAIRALQTNAPDTVKTHFAIGADGSFDLATLSVQARPA